MTMVRHLSTTGCKLVIFLTLLLSPGRLLADLERCAICDKIMGERVYVSTDKVTQQKKQICPDCFKLPHDCFRCGLPVKTNYVELPDGRYLCARDAKNAVLDDDEARQTIADVQVTLDRLFSRFVEFPGTNLETAVVDRINLMALFALPGNDHECPNILGYTQTKTNQGKLTHKISVLSGLPRGELKAVCAHELSHAWVNQNVSAERRKLLGGDAHEGFCELIAYLMMDSQGDEDEKKVILDNRYTRGQILLFIEAENRFGFNEIVEWMKYGADAALHGDDLNRIRNLQITTRKLAVTNASPTYAARPGAAQQSGFVLKGISWTRDRPMAVINNKTFELKEEGHLRIGGTNFLIRCVAIQPRAVRIRIMSTGEERELSLAE